MHEKVPALPKRRRISRQLAQGQFRPFRWQILGEIKRKEEKWKNGKENKKKMFLLPFLRKQRLGC